MTTEEEIIYCLQILRENTPDNLRSAVETLQSLSTDDGHLVGILQQELWSPNEPHTIYVVQSLANLGKAAATCAGNVIHILENSSNTGLQIQCARTLGHIGTDHHRTVTVLQSLLADVDPLLSISAASSLLLISPSQPAIDILKAARTTTNTTLTYWAATGLADAIHQGQEVIDAALDFLTEDDHAIREYISHCLKKLDAKRIIPYLLEKIQKDKSTEKTIGYLFALAYCYVADQEIQKKIESTLINEHLLQSSDSNIRRQAIDVAEAFRLHASPIRKLVLNLLSDTDDWVRARAIDVVLDNTYFTEDEKSLARSADI